MQNQPIVGVWHVAIQVESMATGFEGLYTFFADGNFIEINTYKETNLGVWISSGNGYLVTFWSYLFDVGSQANGKAKVRLAIQLADADHFTAHGVTDTYDLAGQPTANQFLGPVSVAGTRVQVELPPAVNTP